MTVAGIAGFYLSSAKANRDDARAVASHVVDELKPLIVPIVAMLRLWRRARQL